MRTKSVSGKRMCKGPGTGMSMTCSFTEKSRSGWSSWKEHDARG